MKKIITLTILVTIIIYTITSCVKCEEGGYVSKTRLCKNWILTNNIGSETETDAYYNYNMRWTFKRDGICVYELLFDGKTVSTQHLEWELDKKDKTVIRFKFITWEDINMKIIKLTNKELWVEFYDFSHVCFACFMVPYEGSYMKLRKE
jgi:uncharacterized protein YxeA